MTATKTYYPNGQVECEGFVNEELQVGNWTFYHENGKLFSKGQYDNNGNPIGLWTEYYENGLIKYEAISPQGNYFSLDSDNLEIVTYCSEDGIPLIVDGNGKLKIYFDNGNIQHISHWTNKLKNGILQEFYESGQLKLERNYKDGKKEGLGKVFYDNGNLHIEHYFINGNDTGKYREWYENGQLSEEGEYRNREYFIINFWTENGMQILKDGTGKVIRKYGATDGDIYEQYFEQGKMSGEKKVSGMTYGQFIPDKNNKNGL
ncbi:MAG: hypothetical protein A2W85_18765 [Bacteroidetes bacterium GWF2_41_31]|nr:MAG: hypothetical protein A2W85_18765 [Bacteroidetes bacterium GWF2_41_31]OFZ09508.1 MAG: hypothetical protein A2338_02440 [Bacteroidetes bacterium RIFOXYB12_FULL_41_6]